MKMKKMILASTLGLLAAAGASMSHSSDTGTVERRLVKCVWQIPVEVFVSYTGDERVMHTTGQATCVPVDTAAEPPAETVYNRRSLSDSLGLLTNGRADTTLKQCVMGCLSE